MTFEGVTGGNVRTPLSFKGFFSKEGEPKTSPGRGRSRRPPLFGEENVLTLLKPADSRHIGPLVSKYPQLSQG